MLYFQSYSEGLGTVGIFAINQSRLDYWRKVMSCIQSENVLCKHVRAKKTYYADLSFLEPGVTAVSAEADTEAEDLVVEAVEVLAEDMTVNETDDCRGVDLVEGRAVLILLSGGVASDEEVLITLSWVQSDGGEDARELRLIVSGDE